MRNIFIAAAFAVCFALPGMANADLFQAPVSMELMQSGEMDPELVYDILKAAAAQSEYGFGCLCDMHDAGLVDIDKNQSGNYVVTVQEDGGDLVIIAIDESF